MKEQRPIDKEVDRVLSVMKGMDPKDEDYATVVQNLKVLCEARSKKAAFPIEPEAILNAAASILGIVLILQYERLHVVTTRAINFVRK